MPRRRFMKAAVGGLAGSAMTAVAATPSSGQPSVKAQARKTMELRPIGTCEIKEGKHYLRIDEEYKDGLLGLNEWSHVLVFYWFDQNDTPELRRRLQVHPRGNRENPLTGVFACRSPFRPNLIALTVCKIVAVQGCVVEVDHIDAFDGSPLLDLKPFTLQDLPSAAEVRMPAWARRGP
jgi:tRNA-Thr(GGU) m(6)t(6)A37 methyltransferase TsaA